MGRPMARLRVYRQMWGVLECKGGPFASADAAFARIKALGYDGVETGLASVEWAGGAAAWRQLLDKHDLRFAGQAFSFGPNHEGLGLGAQPSDEPAEHLATLLAHVQALDAIGCDFVNAQSGPDWWAEEQAVEYFEAAAEWSAPRADYSPVHHETHRSKYLHTPWVTRRLVERVPQLTLTADLSHFLVTSEADWPPALRQVSAAVAEIAAGGRCRHIHGRVGHTQGPQVSDPRAPEAQAMLEQHLSWWGDIWEAQHKAGVRVMSITPEHGPPPYQPSLPFSQIPTADIWSINHMVGLSAKREFARRMEALGEAAECELRDVDPGYVEEGATGDGGQFEGSAV